MIVFDEKTRPTPPVTPPTPGSNYFDTLVRCSEPILVYSLSNSIIITLKYSLFREPLKALLLFCSTFQFVDLTTYT